MHIYPWMSVYFPKVNELAIQMINDINLVAGLDRSTIRQPIQISTDSERWMLMHEDDCKSLAEQICEFLKHIRCHCFIVWKKFQILYKFLKKKIKRVMMGDAQYVFIIAALCTSK